MCRAVTTSFKHPIISLDCYLLKWSIVLGSALMGNYFLWAFGAPTLTKIGLAAVLLSSAGLFLLKKPSDYLLVKLFFIVGVILTLGSPTDGWDVRSIWLFHAKRMFVDGSLYAQLDDYASWSHNDYPAFVPALSATFALSIGYWNEVVPKSASMFVMLPAICLLASIFKQRLQFLLLITLTLFIGRKFIFSGWMDPLLAMYSAALASTFYLISTFHLRENADNSERTLLVVAMALITSILVLTKNEGFVFLLAATISLLVAHLFLFAVNIEKSGIAALVVAVIPMVAWKIACANHGVPNDLVQEGLLVRLAERMASPHDFSEIIRQFFLRREFLVPLTLFLILVRKNKNNAFSSFLFVSALTYAMAILLVYLATPHDLAWHLRTSAQRTILPVGLLIGYGCIVMLVENTAMLHKRAS